jgi:golgi phosphoprotein 3
MITLFEEILLLTVHNEKGTFIGWTVDRMKPALIGAVLAELALMGKIETSQNNRLHLVDDNPVDDDLLNEALEQLKDSDKERKFGFWVDNLSQKPEKLRKQVIERLIEKGVVAQEDDRLQWVVPSPLAPGANASAKYLISQRLRGIILAQEIFEKRDIVLLSLLRACNLLELTFLKDERRLASSRINELVVGAAMKDPGLQTIEEIESALAMVVEDE